jgi:hypothetical protein
MFRFFLRASAIFLMALFLAGCNLPKPTQQNPNAVFTQAAETVQARLTLESLLVTPSPLALSATPLPPSATLPPTATASPTPLCDLAQFVADVTIPDGAEVLPDQSFTKTWRLKNLGTCTWSSGYQVIFNDGDLMGGPTTQALSGTVGPGLEVDISVTFKAPASPGTYRGYWRLRNPAGVLVPIASGYQGTSFFVEVKVPAPTATPTQTATPSSTPSPVVTP